eukprot:3983694-Alexandrium_andersonii.AAC.1
MLASPLQSMAPAFSTSALCPHQCVCCQAHVAKEALSAFQRLHVPVHRSAPVPRCPCPRTHTSPGSQASTRAKVSLPTAACQALERARPADQRAVTNAGRRSAPFVATLAAPKIRGYASGVPRGCSVLLH